MEGFHTCMSDFLWEDETSCISIAEVKRDSGKTPLERCTGRKRNMCSEVL